MDLFALREHEAAGLLPMLPETDLQELAADIKANGLRQPVVIVDAGGEWQTLDGRNRLRACKIAGIAPKHVIFDGKDPIAYALSMNVQRRHLNASQRAMVAVEVEKIYAAQAKERQREHGGTAPGKKNTSGKSAGSDGESRTKAAAQLNVSPRIVQDAKKVAARAAPEVVEAVRSGRVAVDDAVRIVEQPKAAQAALVAKVDAGEAKTLKEADRKTAKAEVVARISAEPAPLPAGPFRVIAIDPPWRYDSRVEDVSHRGRNPYPDMTVEEICALPVGKLAHDDGCILWLWTTNAFMRAAFQCLDAWGFTEKTILTWDKVDIGLGDWLRNVTEHCIVAVRGKPVVQLAAQSTILRAKRREHSRKPEEFYSLVEGLCPGSKVEMFARAPRAGWSTWGAEAEKFAEAAS